MDVPALPLVSPRQRQGQQKSPSFLNSVTSNVYVGLPPFSETKVNVGATNGNAHALSAFGTDMGVTQVHIGVPAPFLCGLWGEG